MPHTPTAAIETATSAAPTPRQSWYDLPRLRWHAATPVHDGEIAISLRSPAGDMLRFCLPLGDARMMAATILEQADPAPTDMTAGTTPRSFADAVRECVRETERLAAEERRRTKRAALLMTPADTVRPDRAY